MLHSEKRSSHALVPRILCAILAALTVVGIAGCSDGTPDDADITVAEAPGTTVPAADTTISAADLPPEEINRENAVISLPELDFNGSVINILYPGEDAYAQDIVAAEINGDVVNDAVYKRNLAVEDLLEVKLNPISYSDSTQETSKHLATVSQAQEDLYDLCAVHQAYTIKNVADGFFHNFADDKYIDWEKPWWDTEYMKEMVVGDNRIFFLIGDISLMRMKSLACIYYNKDMYEAMYGKPDELYDIVFNGDWTFEKFDQLTREAYNDVNGNGKVDEGDRFGAYGTKGGKSVEHYFYGAGIVTTTKNTDGIPELDMYNEKTVGFTELLHKLYYQNDGFTIATSDYFDKEISAFIGGNYLFAPTWFRHAEQFREMQTDYGIICMPKYDAEAEYTTLVHNGTTIYVSPVTSKKLDMIGAVCEAMAFYNYKGVTPAYYEVALKVKYSRDDKTAQMLDLINDSAFTNFGYVYASMMDSLPYFRSFVKAGATDYTSWYKSKEAAALAALEKIVNVYTALD